jgi:hypothetical protein
VTPAFWRVVGGTLRFGVGFLLFGLLIGAIMEGTRWMLDGMFGRPLDYAAIFTTPVVGILMIIAVVAFFTWAHWLQKREGADRRTIGSRQRERI